MENVVEILVYNSTFILVHKVSAFIYGKRQEQDKAVM